MSAACCCLQHCHILSFSACVLQIAINVQVNEFAMRRQPSFLDYVFGGCQVRWLTGIDFSAATRGAAGQPSIHQATGASMPSPCEAMVTALGSILEVSLAHCVSPGPVCRADALHVTRAACCRCTALGERFPSGVSVAASLRWQVPSIPATR